MASWGAHVGYYEGLSQNFVPDHQGSLGYSVVRQVLPYNHHLWALFCYKPSRNALFTCFYVNLAMLSAGVRRGAAKFHDFATKKKLFTKFDAFFFSWTRLPIFFFRFHRKKQAHETLDPWITCRKAALTFHPKHLRARLNDPGE